MKKNFYRLKVDSAFINGVRVVRGKRYVTPDAFRVQAGDMVMCDSFYGSDHGVIDSIVLNYGGAVLFLRNGTRVPAHECWLEYEDG